MSSYFALDDDRKRMAITQTASRIGLPVQTIEKDLWVSTIIIRQETQYNTEGWMRVQWCLHFCCGPGISCMIWHCGKLL